MIIILYFCGMIVICWFQNHDRMIQIQLNCWHTSALLLYYRGEINVEYIMMTDKLLINSSFECKLNIFWMGHVVVYNHDFVTHIILEDEYVIYSTGWISFSNCTIYFVPFRRQLLCQLKCYTFLSNEDMKSWFKIHSIDSMEPHKNFAHGFQWNFCCYRNHHLFSR